AVLVVPLSPFRALAEADQRSYLINILLIVQAATVTGLGLVLAYLGWGITGQFLAASVALYPLFFFLMRDGLRRYGRVGGVFGTHLLPSPVGSEDSTHPTCAV